MKPNKYTVLLIPDNESAGKSFTFRRRWFVMIVTITIAIITSMGIVGYFFIPRTLEYQRVKSGYNELVKERSKVMNLYNDLQRLQQMEGLLRKNLGADLRPSDYEENPAGFVNNDSITDDVTYSTDRIGNIPTKAPIDGYVTQRMVVRAHAWKNNHYGIDISAREGDPVVASAAGVVIFSGWSTDLGNMVILYHGNEYFTFYGHNQVNLVEKRDIVKRGDVISLAGNTGISSGPHLHFEVWEGSNPLDPLEFFPEYKDKDLSAE